MSFEPRDYLSHILVEADYLLKQSAGLSFDDFVMNETLQWPNSRRDIMYEPAAVSRLVGPAAFRQCVRQHHYSAEVTGPVPTIPPQSASESPRLP